MVEFTARDRLKLLAGAGTALLSACGGGGSTPPTPADMTDSPPPPAPMPETPPPPPVTTSQAPTILSDTFRDNFTMGVALSSPQSDDFNSQSRRIALEHFNGVTPEFELQPSFVAPEEGVFDFDRADRLVDFALQNNMTVRGHSLLWHEQTPDYFLVGSREDIRQRLETYIGTVMEHFSGRIHIWDVVNEAVSTDLFRGDDGVGPDRNTIWYEAVGNADYIDWAFQAARAADPNALLFLNDFETEEPRKAGWFRDIVRRLIERGVPIDGVGHQVHLRLESTAESVLASIDAIQNEFPHLVTHVTEMDISMYTDPGSCYETGTNCLPDLGPNPPLELLRQQAQIYRDVFAGLTQRSFVEYVSLWGVTDGDSAANNNPAVRFNHPLLFDRDGEPKPAFFAITDPNFVI